MSIRQITFNNGIDARGLVATFSRDNAARVYTGTGNAEAVAANQPRFTRTAVLNPAPVVEVVNATTLSARCMAVGTGSVALGSRTLVIIRVLNAAGGSFTHWIYQEGTGEVGSGNAPTLLVDENTAGNGTTKPTRLSDMLIGQADEEADYCHSPRAFSIAHGMIACQCCTYKYAGSGSRGDEANWPIDGVSYVYSTDDGATWTLWGRGGSEDSAGASTDFCAEWSFGLFALTRPGDGLEVWAVGTSYASGATRSAAAFVARARRTSLALNDWTVEPIVRFEQQNFGNTHAHNAELFGINGSGGANLLVHLGDSTDNNRTEAYHCLDIEDYAADIDPMTDADNVLDYSISASGNWEGPVAVLGSTTTEADQCVGPCPGRDADTVYLGSDEKGAGAVLSLTRPDQYDDSPNFRFVYGMDTTSWKHSGWRCFTLNPDNMLGVDPAVVGTMGAGAPFPLDGAVDADYTDTLRVIYKPRGSGDFGVVYPHQGQTNGRAIQRPVVTPEGWIWIADQPSADGVLRFRVPNASARRAARPLVVGPGAVNYALISPTQATAPTAPNTLTLDATPPTTPPGDAKVTRFTATGTQVNMGRLQITADAVPSHTSVIIHAWVYMPDWNGTTVTRTSLDSFRMRLYTIESGVSGTTPAPSGYHGGKAIGSHGAWHLLQFQFDNSVDGGAWDATDVAAYPVRLALQFQTNGSAAVPLDFYFQVAGVYLDCEAPPSYDVPSAASTTSTGAAETMVLDGFACAAEAWTIELAGMLSQRSRDIHWYSGVATGTYRTLATLYESATKHIQIESDAATKVRITCTDGGDTDTHEFTGLPQALHGDPFMVSIAWDGTDYIVRLSFAGTEVLSATIAAPDAEVFPGSIKLGSNPGGTALEGTQWFYASVREDEALTGSEMTERMEEGMPFVSDSDDAAFPAGDRFREAGRIRHR